MQPWQGSQSFQRLGYDSQTIEAADGRKLYQPQFGEQHRWLAFPINELCFLKLAEFVLEKIPSSEAAVLCTAVACICQSSSPNSGGSSKVPSITEDINAWLPVHCASLLLTHFYAEGSIQGTEYYKCLSTCLQYCYLSFYYHGCQLDKFLSGLCSYHALFVIFFELKHMKRDL